MFDLALDVLISLVLIEGTKKVLKGALEYVIGSELNESVKKIATWGWQRAKITYTIEDTILQMAVHSYLENYFLTHPQRKYMLKTLKGVDGMYSTYSLGLPEGCTPIRFKKRIIFVHRAVIEKATESNKEKFTLEYLGKNDLIIKEFLDTVLTYYNEGVYKEISLFTHDSWGNWQLKGKIVTRVIDSIILPKDDLKRLESALGKFLISRAFYNKLGIPYHYGILLFGVPGSGKTSTLKALAGHFGLDIYLCSLSSLSDPHFLALTSKINTKGLLLLEEVDIASPNREGGRKNALTLAGLLEGLDGVSTSENVVIGMTTNKNFSELDPALIRKGRIDFKMEFYAVEAPQVQKLYERFYELCPISHAEDFAREVCQCGEISMADVQHYLLYFKEDEQLAWEQRTLFKQIINNEI